MNAALGLFRPTLHAIWNETYHRADDSLCNETQRCFSVLNSSETVSAVQKYNNQTRDKHGLPLRHCDMTTWDFAARLYTNIPLQDLLIRLFSVIQRCFTHASTQSSAPVVIVDRNGRATWSVEGSTATKRASCFFSEEKLREAVDIIVNGTYFVFGNTLYHQDKGIPMGINCAVHMADQYLWTYELEFLTQLVDAASSGLIAHAPKSVMSKRKHAIKLLKCFTWTCRYIDD